MTDGERDFWRRTQTLEEIHLNTIGREDVGYCLGKHPTVVTAVVSYHHCALLTREGFVDIVGETLCGHAYDILVHTVRTGTHDTAQTACAELEVLVERINEIGLVLIVEHGLYFFPCLLVERR